MMIHSLSLYILSCLDVSGTEIVIGKQFFDCILLVELCDSNFIALHATTFSLFFHAKILHFCIYLPKRETTSLKNQIFTFSRGSFNIPVSSYSWRSKFLFGSFQLFPLKIVILNFCSLIIFFQTNPFQYLRSCIPLAFVHHRNVFRLLVVKVEVWLFSGEVWVVTHTHVTSPLTGQDGAGLDSPSSEMSRRHLALFWGHMLWWRLLVSINIDIVVKKTRPKHIKCHDSFLQISKWTFASYVW